MIEIRLVFIGIGGNDGVKEFESNKCKDTTLILLFSNLSV